MEMSNRKKMKYISLFFTDQKQFLMSHTFISKNVVVVLVMIWDVIIWFFNF